MVGSLTRPQLQTNSYMLESLNPACNFFYEKKLPKNVLNAYAQSRFLQSKKLHSPKSYILLKYSGYLYPYPSGFKFNAPVLGWAQIKECFAALQ